MNTVAHNVVAKLSVALVAVAMLFTMVSPAKAATSEEMQAQIAALLAQVAALQAQMGGSTSSSSDVCPFTWTRGLKQGMSGADVMKLQQFLNADAETRVAASGVGSVGQETQYFGPATMAAVSRFQVKYRAEILTPSGLVNPTGYFGPASMAKANALCVSGGSDDSDDDSSDDDSDDDSSDDDSDDSDDSDLSGEASLDKVEVSDGEDVDDVEEGSEDVQVAEVEVSFNDGDAMITRLDLALESNASANEGDDDPWEVFQEVSLWVDGDEVARVDASDEDEYLEEDDGSLRFSGLDIRANEDEDVTIVVAVTVNDSVDGAVDGDGENWTVAVGGVRYMDADDVTTTDTDTGDIIDITSAAIVGNSAAVDFDIEVEGEGDDLDLESSEADPDATTFGLDEDENTEEAIFAFDLSAEDSDGDIDLNEITVQVRTLLSGGDASIDELVSDFRLEIGDNSYDAESYTGSGTTTSLVFDIDGDETVGADDVVTATLFADFENMSTSALAGATIQASTSPSDIEAEGSDDVTVDGSTVTGETHTLRTTGVDVDVDDANSDTEIKANSTTDATDDEGVFTLEFEVTAFGDDLYIDDVAGRGTTMGTNGVNYLLTIGGTASTSGTAVASLDSTADVTSGGFFKVNEGETETFTLTVEYDPAASASYKVQLYSVNFNVTADTAPSTQQVLSPASDYDSDSLTI